MKLRVFVAAAILALMSLLAVACSGDGGDESEPVGEGAASLSEEELAEANAPIEQVDSGSGGIAVGPINGLVTVQPSFGFGAYVVDPATETAAAIPGIAAVETVDRNNDVVLGNGAAYALGGKVRPGQQFASDISVVRIDLTTGQSSLLASLGPDRESDIDTSSTQYRLEAVAGDAVVVSSRIAGATEADFTVYDGATGEVRGSFAKPTYAFESDSGTCRGDAADFVGLSDGRLAAVAVNSPAFVDIDSGEVELLIGCQDDDPELSQFVSPDQLADYAVFAEGPAPTPEMVERFLQQDLEPRQGFVEGNGDVWWINVDAPIIDDVRVMVGGVVQFDLATASVEAVHPLGAQLGEFTDCAPDTDVCEWQSLEQAEMRFIDGRLVMVDGNRGGMVHLLDPATGSLTSTAPRLGDGIDYTDTSLLNGDPNGVWLEVRRMTINSDDDAGFTASGTTWIERLDTATGDIDLSIPGEDLFF